MRAILPSILLLSGCLCGAYDGAGDTMYRRGDDSMILCSNGGFAATLPTGIVEGRYEALDDGSVRGSAGETGAQVFVLADARDGTWTSTELGAGWQIVALDKTDLDHADVQCTDLEMRAWWSTAGGL